MSRIAPLVACLILLTALGRAGAQAVANAVNSGDELQALNVNIRRSFTGVEMVPVDTSYAGDDQNGEPARAAKFQTLKSAELELEALQLAARPASGSPDRAGVSALVDKIQTS